MLFRFLLVVGPLLLLSVPVVLSDGYTRPVHRKLRQFRSATRIDRHFVVLFDPGRISNVDEKVTSMQSKHPTMIVTHIYRQAIKGVSFEFPETTSSTSMDGIFDDEDVLYGEEVRLLSKINERLTIDIFSCPHIYI